jgi:hypothetical protein
MSAARLKGEAPSPRALWRAELEESKKDMGLLDGFARTARDGQTRRKPAAVLKLWDERKTEVPQEPFSFDDFLRETGT